MNAMNQGITTSADEPDDPTEALLRLGERQGYLTYEMLNDRLPDGVAASAANLDAFLAAADRRGIRLIDADDAP
jgi:hypothetical protein